MEAESRSDDSLTAKDGLNDAAPAMRRGFVFLDVGAKLILDRSREVAVRRTRCAHVQLFRQRAPFRRKPLHCQRDSRAAVEPAGPLDKSDSVRSEAKRAVLQEGDRVAAHEAPSCGGSCKR